MCTFDIDDMPSPLHLTCSELKDLTQGIYPDKIYYLLLNIPPVEKYPKGRPHIIKKLKSLPTIVKVADPSLVVTKMDGGSELTVAVQE